MQHRPIYQHFPGRAGSESLQRLGTLEILDSGEMRVRLDAIPIGECNLIVLADAPAAGPTRPPALRTTVQGE